MKAGIHPTYFPEVTAECSCGAKFVVGSTKEKIHVEICSQCHPFYTGNEKLIDTAGRVEKYKARLAISEKKSAAGDKRKPVKKASAKVPAKKRK